LEDKVMPKKLLPMSDPQGALATAYQANLRQKAQVLRSSLLIDRKTRESIANDLELLATISEIAPREFYRGLAVKK
jgi:hypothetical protein